MVEPVPIDGFEDPPPGEGDEAFILNLAAYEGPIHVLLDQAREQKVDLTQISILALAEQYLAFIERARRLRIELAADYLVMAAWLAYLKSRLLLPAEAADEEPSGAELAEALAFQLRRLEAMRMAGARLMTLPQAGRDFFCRGEPEALESLRIPVYGEGLHDLLAAYGRHLRRSQGMRGGLTIEASRLYSMDQALQRLTQLLGGTPGWATLSAFLPPGLADPLLARSALAATFAASLELARSGVLELRQSGAFQPIYVRRQEGRP